MSAAFHSLHGPAPMRTHSDDAFLLGFRKLGDFLMEDWRRYGDDVLALDYLPTGLREPEPAYLAKAWRRPMNKQLTHIAYERVRRPQPWDHRKWIPPLEAEFRNAWRNFLGAVTNAAFKAEYERQI